MNNLKTDESTRRSTDRIELLSEFDHNQWSMQRGHTLSAASGLSGFLSGWYLSASFRYVFLISSGVAVLERPNISYNVSPDVLHEIDGK